MTFDERGNVLCEQCNQPNGPLYCCFPNHKGFPYLQVCAKCVADIGAWAHELKEMCDDDGKYVWTGEIVDGCAELMWSEGRGQVFQVAS